MNTLPPKIDTPASVRRITDSTSVFQLAPYITAPILSRSRDLCSTEFLAAKKPIKSVSNLYFTIFTYTVDNKKIKKIAS